MRTVMYIFWAIFVVVAVFSIVHMYLKMKRHEQRTNKWPRVEGRKTGEFTRGWTSGAGGLEKRIRYFTEYQFFTSHGVLIKGKTEIPSAEVPRAGDPIEVYYNPADPTESYEQSPKPKLAFGCAAPFMIIMAVAFYFFIGIFPE